MSKLKASYELHTRKPWKSQKILGYTIQGRTYYSYVVSHWLKLNWIPNGNNLYIHALS